MNGYRNMLKPNDDKSRQNLSFSNPNINWSAGIYVLVSGGTVVVGSKIRNLMAIFDQMLSI